ncbi:6634_t:CDS:2 [Acaulospora colombiana]|uniref:6634_t:CDS:1 n=1 Tax=Acaulospora colombiana TaxID=27376 RepID=A0ACA9KL06_9GLOM|nr:6634_t:CDS:2 [Acaulospora colombiana]
MSDNNTQPHAKWFKILFKTLQQHETIIEFLSGDKPPEEFFDIINNDNIIKVMKNDLKEIYYWFKNDKKKIINKAIQYMHKKFKENNNIRDIDKKERDKFKNDFNNIDDQKKLEWKMQNELLTDIKEKLPEFPYVYEYGWKYKKGVSNLILTNGKGHYKRAFINQYCEQGYVEQHGHRIDIIAVIVMGITDEEHVNKHWPELFDK